MSAVQNANENRPTRKGDMVRYETNHGLSYSAIVRRVHRDGSGTIEARFPLDANGNERTPGYLMQTSGSKKADSGTICAAGGNTSKLRRDCCRRRNRL